MFRLYRDILTKICHPEERSDKGSHFYSDTRNKEDLEVSDNNNKKKKIAAAAILAAAVIILAAVTYMLISVIRNGYPADKKLVFIESDGKVMYELPLNEDKEIIIGTKYGENVVSIKDCMVSVTRADCKNKICVNTMPISDIGQTIVCLPHKLVVSIKAGNAGK